MNNKMSLISLLMIYLILAGNVLLVIRQQNLTQELTALELKLRSDIEKNEQAQLNKEEQLKRTEEQLKREGEQLKREGEQRQREEEQRRREEEQLKREEKSEQVSDDSISAPQPPSSQQTKETLSDDSTSGQPEKNAKNSELQKKLDKLNSQLNDLRKQSAELNREKGMMLTEIRQLDQKISDPRFICFDSCIIFKDIQFRRIMKRLVVKPGLDGYYTCLHGVSPKVGKHLLEKVDVSYTCTIHNQTWTQNSADDFRSEFTPLRDLESKRAAMRQSLNRRLQRKIDQNDKMISELEGRIESLKRKMQ